MNKGKIIVFEGLDCSFKETNAKKLKQRLESEEYKVKLLSFPNYESDSSYFIKKHLNGELDGLKGEEVYQISLYYALDRAITMKRENIKEYLNKGYIIILDRYITSNMVFQSAKLNNAKESINYIKWLKDLEYKKLNLPKPDKVIFMDMPVEASSKIIAKRKNKSGEDNDIYESNIKFMKHVRFVSLKVAHREKWDIVHCVNKFNIIRNKNQISGEIYNKVSKFLNQEGIKNDEKTI